MLPSNQPVNSDVLITLIKLCRTNREHCLSVTEFCRHETSICHCVHYVHGKMLKRVGKKKKSIPFQISSLLIQRGKAKYQLPSDLNDLCTILFIAPFLPSSFPTFSKEKLTVISPSSLNLILVGPSVLLHNL